MIVTLPSLTLQGSSVSLIGEVHEMIGYANIFLFEIESDRAGERYSVLLHCQHLVKPLDLVRELESGWDTDPETSDCCTDR